MVPTTRQKLIMPRFNDDDFSKRRETSDKARKAMVVRFRARPSKDDPGLGERKAARVAVGRAREARVKAREVARKTREEESAQLVLDRAERDLADRRAEADRAVNLLAEQKAARDTRYAARKKRRS